MPRNRLCAAMIAGLALTISAGSARADEVVSIHADVLADRIQGGLLGQILGNLNGLPHELKYNGDEPGHIVSYTPALPDGAWTDDDTDLEWMYIVEMQRSGEVFVPPARIAELWQQHANSYIWCSNLYARRLMDLGIAPPLTGRIAINPWAVFNISGQFVCEAFGLIAPAMPQTASELGLHYTHVTIDGEPAQTTQLFDSMIAIAFIEPDVEKIVAAGAKAVDPKSEVHAVVRDVREWFAQHPDDWRTTRRLVHQRYTRHGGGMRDINGHALNTAAIIGSLLYGHGDLTETMRLAFCWGYDADCNAATAATVIGVLKGRRWMESQGWTLADRYRNVARPGLPNDETIIRYGKRLVAVAANVILRQGGHGVTASGLWRIPVETPANVEPLPEPLDRMNVLHRELLPEIERDLAGSRVDRARAAYLAICLDEAKRLAQARPADWSQAIEALQSFEPMVEVLFKAPPECAADLQKRAKAAGLKPPDAG